MLVKKDDSTYVIEKSMTLKEDLIIEKGEKLLICGRNTKVTAGDKNRVTIINKGVIDNQAHLILLNCDMDNQSNDFVNKGMISICRNSVLYQGREQTGAIGNSGVIDVTDQGRFVNGESQTGTCYNVGSISIGKDGVFENGAAGKGNVVNKGTFLLKEKTSLVRGENSVFDNYGTISGRLAL